MIKKMNLHYSFTNPASVHDEEALTALELAGRQGAKINEVIEDQNALRTETEIHLSEQDKDIESKYAEQNRVINAKFSSQDKKIDDRLNAQDEAITDIRENTVPEDVTAEVQKRIDDGSFNEQINTSLGNLRERVDNLLGGMEEGTSTLDAEIIDSRLDFTNNKHSSMGESTREADALIQENAEILAKLIDKKISIVSGENDLLSDMTLEQGYLIKDGNNKGAIISDTYANTTDYIDLLEHPELYITATANYSSCIGALYDINKNCVGVFGHNNGVTGSEEYSQLTIYHNVEFNLIDALEISPLARYVRISVFNNSSKSMKLTEPIRADIKSEIESKAVAYDNVNRVISNGIKNKYVDINTGSLIEAENSWYTNLIDVAEADTYIITAKAQHSVTVVAYYAEDGTYLGSGVANAGSEGKLYYRVYGSQFNKPETEQTIAKVRFSSYGEELVIEKPRKVYLQDVIDTVGKQGNSNILAGKVFFAFGDSFVEGDFDGVTDTYNYDAIYGYKTYPYWIATRNNMHFANYGMCGSTWAEIEGAEWCGTMCPAEMMNIQNGKYMYNNENTYALFQFGLNDQTKGVELGSYSSNGTYDKTTFIGAIEYTFNELRSKLPYAKIGVIVSNAYLNEQYANAIRICCERWGVPYIDMMNDNSISTTLNKGSLCSTAKAYLDSAYMVDKDGGNTHPNIEAHKVMSNAIEQFMRGL